MKSINLLRDDVYWFCDGNYYHIIKYAIQDNGEIYIHFVSRNKKAIHTNLGCKSMIDHISFHKDGTVHIKHKNKERTLLPFKEFHHAPFAIPHKVNFPILAVTYYYKNFHYYKNLFTKRVDKPSNGHIISAGQSFTVIFHIRDCLDIPQKKRELIVYKQYSELPILEDINNMKGIGKATPLINIHVIPNRKYCSLWRNFGARENI